MPALNIRGLLLIALAVALTFANALHDGFHFDDDHSLVANPHIRQLGEIPNFFSDPQLFSRNQGSEMYRPLVLLSYAINYRFFAYQALVYHLFNIGVHLLVVCAVYGLYLRLGLRGVTALGGAILFGIHPLVSGGNGLWPGGADRLNLRQGLLQPGLAIRRGGRAPGRKSSLSSLYPPLARRSAL